MGMTDMAELKSMKMKPEPAMYPTMAAENDHDNYGYGMQLCFYPEQVAALGISGAPVVGSKMSMQVEGVVKSVSMDGDGLKIDFQVQEAGIMGGENA
jgi:hypothetical protein